MREIKRANFTMTLAAVGACMLLTGATIIELPESRCPEADEALGAAAYESAVDLYTACLETKVLRQDERADILLIRAEALSGLQRVDLALEDFGAAIELAPNSAVAYLLRATLLDSLERFEEAVADYTASIEIDPIAPASYWLRGNGYRNLGQFERALADVDEAIRLAGDSAEAAPMHYLRGLILLDDFSEREEALEAFRRTSDLDPSLSRQLQRRLGWEHYGEREWARSIDHFSLALEVDPAQPDALSLRGGAYVRAGQPDLGILDLNEALSIAPADPKILIARGNAWRFTGQYETALADYVSAIEFAKGQDRRSAHAHNDMCWTLSLIGYAKSARPHCERALELEPNVVPTHDSLAFVLWQLGDVAGAEAKLEAAFELGGASRFGSVVERLENYPVVLVSGLLNAQGYGLAELDDHPADERRAAIERYQRDHGLTVDGEISDELIIALKASLPPIEVPAIAVNP